MTEQTNPPRPFRSTPGTAPKVHEWSRSRATTCPFSTKGIIAEHQWTRTHAGLFDVSHMGQLLFHGPDLDRALETLLPGDLMGLKDGRLRYSMLLGEDGGIIDDLTSAARRGDHFYLVVNGATKAGDIEQFPRPTCREPSRWTI